MKYWFNDSERHNNVVILSKKALLLASVEYGAKDKIAAQLEQKIHPQKIFTRENTQVIPFVSIQELISSDSDTEIEISFKQQSKIENIEISFSDIDAKLTCYTYIEKLLKVNKTQLHKNELKKTALFKKPIRVSHWKIPGVLVKKNHNAVTAAYH